MDGQEKGSRLVFVALTVVFLLGMITSCAPGPQATYPNKPIELVVASSAGAVTDVFARFMADELGKKWNVPINVVNKAGGGSVPGVQYVMQAAPDGYTLITDGAAFSSTQALMPDAPFKVLDRTFLVRVSASPHGFMVSASKNWKDFDAMVAEIKKDPAAFKWASTGGQSTIDITARQMFKAIGVDYAKTTPVVFPGAAPGMTAVAGGQVFMIATNPKTELPFVQSGNAKILVITAPKRLSWLPDVPTTAEVGLKQLDYQYWAGFSGPPGLPDYVAAKWDQSVQELLKDEGFLKRLDEKTAMSPFYANSKDFKAFVATEIDTLKELFPPTK